MQQHSPILRTRLARPVHKAFTLIELLVVIAIIALLAAILFPVFARARENARKSSCANNLKQLALGVTQYVQDYDEAFPQAWGGTVGGNYCWFQTIYPYVKSTQVYNCPSDSSRISGGNGFATAGAAAGLVSGAFHVSYGVNFPLFGNGNYGSTTAFNLSDLVKPSQTVMMSDTGITASATAPFVTNTVGSKGSTWLLVDPTCANGNTAKPCNSPGQTNSGDTNWSAANPRHLETVNVAFADGHIKAMQTSKFYYQDTNWLNPRVGGP